MTCEELLRLMELNTQTLGLSSALLKSLVENWYAGHEDTMMSILNGGFEPAIDMLERSVDMALKIQNHVFSVKNDVCLNLQSAS